MVNSYMCTSKHSIAHIKGEIKQGGPPCKVDAGGNTAIVYQRVAMCKHTQVHVQDTHTLEFTYNSVAPTCIYVQNTIFVLIRVPP